ncbi:hypothetical protein [Paenibacillus kobensis]|uniref:hypothetical protein n=1 Tax=Paenibacillus kobensis TaxID=59841 RepID=UPI000FDC669C|nr:hypothetical protein [Paenibacillus kobensis]
MKKLNGKHLNSLLFYLHNDIHESADWSFQSLRNNKLQEMVSYPPNVEITTSEINKLIEVLDSNPGIEETLKKIMINASMYPLFNLFNIIDGSGDIPDSNYEKVELIECRFEEIEDIEDREDFIHDLLFSTYWDWVENNKFKDE